MTNPITRESLPPGGPELTVESLAPVWRLSEYTLREWAGQGLIEGAVQCGGRWRFPAQPRLRAPVQPGAVVCTEYQSVDLAAYPLPPSAVAITGIVGGPWKRGPPAAVSQHGWRWARRPAQRETPSAGWSPPPDRRRPPGGLPSLAPGFRNRTRSD